MKKLLLTFSVILLYSCTSNTIFEEPENLIPKDTMQMLMKDMIIASSSRYLINKNKQKNIDYMPLVYNKYGIDSARFQQSNLYYLSKIDDYKKMIAVVQQSLEDEKKIYTGLKKEQDSIRNDSISKSYQKIFDARDSSRKSSNIDLLEVDSLVPIKKTDVKSKRQRRVDSIKKALREARIKRQSNSEIKN